MQIIVNYSNEASCSQTTKDITYQSNAKVTLRVANPLLLKHQNDPKRAVWSNEIPLNKVLQQKHRSVPQQISSLLVSAYGWQFCLLELITWSLLTRSSSRKCQNVSQHQPNGMEFIQNMVD